MYGVRMRFGIKISVNFRILKPQSPKKPLTLPTEHTEAQKHSEV